MEQISNRGPVQMIAQFAASYTRNPTNPMGLLTRQQNSWRDESIKWSSGEENEIVIYSHLAELYRFRNWEWKLRGYGQVKILQHKETHQLR